MGVFLNLFTGSNRGVPVSAANPLPVTGTFAPPVGGATETEQQTQTEFLEQIATVVTSPDPTEVVTADSTPYCNTAVGTAKYQVGSGGRVLTDYFIENPDEAAKAYLQFFDAASVGAVTLGTTAPKWSIGLAAGEAANLSGLALTFPLGLVIAATSTPNGSGAPSTPMVVNLGHRGA